MDRPRTVVFDKIFTATKPIIICYGGAGSSKSHSMAQFMVWKLIKEQNKVIGIGRKTFPSLRRTAYLLITDILKDWGLYSLCDHSKSDNYIDYGSNRIQFFSLDDPEKIKSFTANYIWLEEANEFTFEDYIITKLRLNKDPGKDLNQIFLTFNPVDSWIFDKLEVPDAEWIHSTYKDNPFLAPTFIKALEDLINQSANYYSIYTLGKRGTLENIIYPDWTLIDEMPTEFQVQGYGLDFGYENPSACIHIGFIGNNLYLDEVVYQTHLTNADLIDILKQLPRLDFHADSSEPQRIEELCRAGVNTYPAMKDVQLGIDTMKRYMIHLTKRSANLIKEFRTYQRKKDKSGRILEDPVKFNDHGLDATRYGVAGLVGLQPLIPQEKIIVFDTMGEMDEMEL